MVCDKKILSIITWFEYLITKKKLKKYQRIIHTVITQF